MSFSFIQISYTNIQFHTRPLSWEFAWTKFRSTPPGGFKSKLEILSVCFSASMTQCQLRVHLFCVPPAGICEGIIKTPLLYHPQYKLRLPPSPSLFGSFSPISKKLRTSTVINCAFISVCLSIVLEYMGFVVTVVPFIPFLQWRISMSSIVANITINVRPLKGGT